MCQIYKIQPFENVPSSTYTIIVQVEQQKIQRAANDTSVLQLSYHLSINTNVYHTLPRNICYIYKLINSFRQANIKFKYMMCYVGLLNSSSRY